MSQDTEQKNFCHTEEEDKLYSGWLKKNLFAAKPNSKNKKFSLVMPPPNVTGTLHIGHALNMTLQDVLARFWRMNNRDVLWQPGTDHAGIATQSLVEKKIQARNHTKETLGKAKFISEIWKWKQNSGDQIVKQIKKIGASPDWNRLKFTLDPDMSNAVNYAFIKLYNKKLIYKDKRLVNWDIKLQTAISDLEVEQKECEGKFFYIKYFLQNSNEYLVVATTRPETIFGDVCIAVNPNDKRYKNFIGKNVILPLVNKIIPVIGDKYVDLEKGTGALKVTPAHDFNDYKIGKKHKFLPITIFNKAGKFNELVPRPYQNIDRIKARDKIIEDLRRNHNLYKIKNIRHFVPFGDRSNTIIEPYLTDQWFLDVKKMANSSISQVKNKSTVFVPSSWTKTFYSWMSNIEPWCISRQIWWGHQIPVWYGPDNKKFVANSEKEAMRLAKKLYKKKTKLTRDKDVLDTWFSSSLWPLSTLGWPKKNQYFNSYFPTSVLVTGFDIIFFWVARMIMQSLFFSNRVPFKKVYIHALVRDKYGQKMSKSKGNVINPLELIDKFGADPLRLTLTLMAAQGRDIKLSEEAVKINRNFVTKIWNAYNFLKKNDCIKKSYKISQNSFDSNLIKIDINNWVLEASNALIEKVNSHLKNFRFNDAAREIFKFTKNIYCDWYLEFLKVYILKCENLNKIKEIKKCSYNIFINTLKIAHPFMPFVTDELYHNKMQHRKFLLEEKWPKPLEINKKKDDILNVEKMISFISKVRKLKIDLKAEPKVFLKVICIYNKKNNLNFLKINTDIINNMARVSFFVEDKPSSFSKKGFLKFIFKNSTFYIERPKHNKRTNIKDKELLKIDLKKIEREIERLNAKLFNRSFIDKAPKEIIKLTKDKLKLNQNSKEKILKEINS